MLFNFFLFVYFMSEILINHFFFFDFFFSYDLSANMLTANKRKTGEYSCIYVDLIFKREFSYYLILIYVPCCMLVIVSWVSFWIDPNSTAARVLLGVTSLLTMSRQNSGNFTNYKIILF